MEAYGGTFASYESTGNALGLANAWQSVVHLRRFGYTGVRLTTLQWGAFTVHQVTGTEPVRPTRTERGASL
jgi:hypothetical protein